jgi:hypothetical protein
LTPAGTLTAIPLCFCVDVDCVSAGLVWSPELRSKRCVIVDADRDGFGRSVYFHGDPPPGQSEHPNPCGWDALLSAASLSELAACAPSSVVTWAIRADKPGPLTAGVALPNASIVPGRFGADDRTWGVFLSNATNAPKRVHANKGLSHPGEGFVKRTTGRVWSCDCARI